MYNLKIAFRKLFRDGIYSFINIGGLAVGMAAAMLIMLWVYNEWSYDRFHKKGEQIYQVMNYSDFMGSSFTTSRLIGPALVNDYPEVTAMTRLNKFKETCTYNENKINAEGLFVDPEFLTMFTFPLSEGNLETALNNPASVVITRSLAERLFGKGDPMGKTIMVSAKVAVAVTGIMETPPSNSQFQFELIFPFRLMDDIYGPEKESWGDYETQTFVELKPGADVTTLNQSVKDIILKRTNGEDKVQTVLQPLSKLHLYTQWENGQPVGGLIETLRLFTFIAFLVLLIACINFMNLSTARSVKRAREVGVRKVIGAGRALLIRQFLSESFLVTFIAALIAIVLLILCLPVFNNIMNEHLELHVNNAWLWLALLIFVGFTGLVAGSYPAFYLSSFLPAKVLKGLTTTKKTAATPRKLLIVLQFTSAIVLIVGTIVVYRQVQYAQDRHSGYNKDQLICLSLMGDMNKNQELIRRDLEASGAAVSVTRTMGPMTQNWNSTWGIQWKGKNENEKTPVNRYYVDCDWAKTTGVKILQGREIDFRVYSTDSTAVLLNEAAAKLMGFKDPIGEIIRDRGRDWHVIGVVEDFILDSPYESVRPMIIGGPAGFFSFLYIKLNGAHPMNDNIKKVEKVLATYNPDFPFDYQFVDEAYARKFAKEQRSGILATWFAGLAIFISCLGLFGLSAYMAENRRKEIGIRKVLGASVKNITALLSKEFLILVFISILIATPIAWWAMNKWLANYLYRTDIPWWLFALVGLSGLIIALVTVSSQAIKAATANPVKSIKVE